MLLPTYTSLLSFLTELHLGPVDIHSCSPPRGLVRTTVALGSLHLASSTEACTTSRWDMGLPHHLPLGPFTPALAARQ